MRHALPPLCLVGLIVGCNPAADSPAPVRPPVEARRPADPQPPGIRAESRPASGQFTGETSRDRAFADFLRDKSGGMVRQASVALDQRGRVRVELDRSAAPDDTLPLTNSIITGARRDFPDQPIDLALYDPTGDLILHARYKVGQGVKYQLAGESKDQPVTGGEPAREAASTPRESAPRAEESNRSGVTAADRAFAEWAEEHGKAYLRYVEADLERHHRLWFGVTREVKPADVPNLTKSLLMGAHEKFPQGDLVATVFDPEGGKIGRATLGRDGSIRWEQ